MTLTVDRPVTAAAQTRNTAKPEAQQQGMGPLPLLGLMGAGLLFLGLEGKVKAVPPRIETLENGQWVVKKQPLQVEPLFKGSGKGGRAATMGALAAASGAVGAGVIYGSAKMLGDDSVGPVGKIGAVAGLGLGVGAAGSAVYFLSKIR